MSEQAGAATAGDNSTGQEAAHWADALPADLTFEDRSEDGKFTAKPLKEHAKLREFKDVGGLAKSYVEQQKLLGKKTLGLAPLPENATEEQRKAWDAEYRKTVGVPDDPGKYAFTGEVPEGYNLDNPHMADFKKLAHGLGLTPGQYNGLTKHLFDMDAKFKGEAEAAAKKAVEEGEATMRTEWGDKYDENKHQAERVLSQFAEDDFVKKLKESGQGNDPAFLRFLGKLAPHFKEDGLKGGGDGALDTPVKTLAELESLMAARDDKGRAKYGNDAAFTAMVDAEFKRAYPGKYKLPNEKTA